MDTGELQKLKESPKADEEIKVQLDKIIEFKEKIKVREEYLKKFEEARKKGELSEDPDFQYDREVDTSFELGKLGRGIENVSKVIHVEKNGKVVKTMLKPIAGRQLDGSHFVDGKERKIFDMEQLMAEFNKGNLTTEGKIVLLEAYEQALEGSAKMEKEGYIHRDLKPPNILLTSDGAALTDFGSTVRAKDDMRIALYGGTLIYSPPEAMGSRLDLSSDPTQCAGLSSKMDVWSWGMMFHQIVSEEGMADHAIFSGLDLGAIEDKEFDQTIMGHLYQNGFRSEEFREKYETDYHKEPKPAGTLQHLAWECTHLDPDKRPSMAEALTKFRAAKKTLLESLPPPIE